MDQKIQIIVIETVNLLDWHLILTLVKHTNDTIGRSSLTCLRPLDFTPLFNWNTKQVFVTVVAQYENEKFERNQVVLWDKIITSQDKKHLKLRNVRNKYAMIDVGQRWNFQNASLTLLWDVTPYVGVLQAGQSNKKASPFVLPSFASQQK
ncbi:unnamed protein product [Mucor circinelloides]